MKRIRRIGALLALVFSISACSSSMQVAGGPAPSVPTAPGDYRIRPHDVVGGGHKRVMMVKLGDVALPNGVNLTQVNVGIDEIYVTDPYGNRVTVAQYSSPHVINVVQYQDGSTTQIASGSVPTTTYSSMTIIVDRASSSVVTASGSKGPLVFRNAADKSSAGFGAATSTATATSSVALTFNRSFAVTESGTPNFDVDFNAFESILPVPYSGVLWTTRASLSVAQEGLEGMITGQVVNASGKAVHNAVVVAIDASGDAVASSFTDSSGNFLLHTLAAGSYKLTVYNNYTTASGWHIVASGNTKSNASFAGPAKVQVVPGQTAFVAPIAD
jgi:Carboxypeptidase regulatory-like domain/Domain of unknown function (DUF4382)